VTTQHVPVMLAEVLEALAPRAGGRYVDGTLGGGGYSAAILAACGPDGRVLGLDADPAALERARARLAGFGERVSLAHANFRALGQIAGEQGFAPCDGVVLDLGLSSDQLGWPHRGFSFAVDGPLDMRYDPRSGPTAADLVNTLDEEELARIFFEYGEERHGRRVARRIVEARRIEPIMTTGRLAELVRKSIPGKWGAIDPATRVFQALRLEVNDELDHLDDTLADLPDALNPGGRAAILSFHSLEDRRVKGAFRDDSRLSVLTRKPVVASAEEVAINPRARSAKLRVAERCPELIGPPEPPDLRPRGRTPDR
jgi:16S rRNA (cytosine1402-N4)-methyltransferase